MTDYSSQPNSAEAPWELLTYYFTGVEVLGREEREQVERWIAENPAQAPAIAAFRKSLETLQGPGRPIDMDAFKAEALAKIGRVQETRTVNISLQVPRSAPRFMFAVAACAVLAFASWRTFQNKSNTNAPTTEAFKTYTTRAGQRASLTLNDGSRVTIGPATTLRVALDDDAVSVDVVGEALFSVNHAAQRPFTVSAHGVTARVLGTEFVVRAFDASLVRVSVRDGRVSVQSPTLTPANAAIVTAGEVASVTKNSVPSVTEIADMETEFAWASGNLVLRNVPLGEAFARLSRWYGLEFRVADPELLQRQVNGTFPTVFSPTDMKSLAKVIGAQVTQSQNRLTFFNRSSL